MRSELTYLFGRCQWTDWGTLQHEAALGCGLEWREWVVAFSAAWEAPFFVYDCGRAESVVEGVLAWEELLEQGTCGCVGAHEDDVSDCSVEMIGWRRGSGWDVGLGEGRVRREAAVSEPEREGGLTGLGCAGRWPGGFEDGFEGGLEQVMGTENGGSSALQGIVGSHVEVASSYPEFTGDSSPVREPQAAKVDGSFLSSFLTSVVYLAFVVGYATWISMSKRFDELQRVQ